MTWQTVSTSSAHTEQLGERLGKSLRGGEVIELISDLGGGKTTFVRGLARGAGSQDKVASPTFTISKVYQADEFEIHHFDFYRLPEPGVVADELSEVMGEASVVVVIEWAGVVQHVLPEKRLTIKFSQTPEGARKLMLTCHEDLAYVLEAIRQ